MPPPPPPIHLLRIHNAPVSALSLSKDTTRIYSGDASGTVSVTSVHTLRPLSQWHPHSDSILTVLEWLDANSLIRIITHGRDNKLHVWSAIEQSEILTSSALESLPKPDLLYSMDVNAMNFCPLSLLPCDPALIALPNLVESSQVDIWALPSRDRIHAGIGKASASPSHTRGDTGIIMSVHLFHYDQETPEPDLRVCAAYEFGGIILRRYANQSVKPKSVEGKGWDVIWSWKPHADSIMAMQVSSDNTFALSVSADNLIVKYSLIDGSNTVYRKTHAGNGCIAIRQNGRICAVGGWDGRIRLYSTKTFKELGALKYHKESCQSLAFMDTTHNTEEDEEEWAGASTKEERKNWLVSGGKDSRLAIWRLMDFGG